MNLNLIGENLVSLENGISQHKLHLLLKQNKN